MIIIVIYRRAKSYNTGSALVALGPDVGWKRRAAGAALMLYYLYIHISIYQ
jgi:hypothetical protein